MLNELCGGCHMFQEDCICGPLNAMCSRVVITPMQMQASRDCPVNRRTLEEWRPFIGGLLTTLGTDHEAKRAVRDLWHDLVLTTTMLHDSTSAKYDPRQDPASMLNCASGRHSPNEEENRHTIRFTKKRPAGGPPEEVWREVVVCKHCGCLYMEKP